MTCRLEKLENVNCINCGWSDRIFIGHGKVHFCSRCSISWDEMETKLLEFQKTTIQTDEQDGELPPEILENIGILVGKLEIVFNLSDKLSSLDNLPESLFLDDIDQETDTKALGDSDQAEVLVGGFTDAMRAVYNALKMMKTDIDKLSDELYEARVKEFNSSVSGYIDLLGCAGNGKLSSGTELDFFRTDSNRDALLISDTYNYDLAKAIQRVRSSVPTANRGTYTKRLRDWDDNRKNWKLSQIALHTILPARDQALKSFAYHNKLEPKVRLRPGLAKEPICQGWVNRGWLDFKVAVSNPSPYHPGCVHYWEPDFSTETEGDCANLWVG